MNINLSLLGQMITFALFVWFTMRYVWPPISQALLERQQHIAAGLAAAEKGVQSLEDARSQVDALLQQAKKQAAGLLEQAEQRAMHLVEHAKKEAREEASRLLLQGRQEIDREVNAARLLLRQDIARLAVLGAEKVLSHHIDAAANEALLLKLAEEI